MELARKFATSFEVERKAFANSFANLLSAGDAHLSVAELENKTVGYVLGFDHFTFFANGRVAWVEEIMVLEDFRRQGIGKLLMEDFEQWASLRGSKLIALATRRASSFYQALGYDESAVYFRKRL
ncbi:GNAT family N-acetyltransferase [Pedosphaera parvula]|uniref:GCN5-related N-acetyltransferase n=1 Tax=Pedosphaera parvula (strain Ellin514) TaxID=320771 RepID=B9XI37_PEDPL|nr:GNAT family N-acetyltransferase [Pedosphaera parvula]EEF60530.1 GCN5-related N-acetyltransferase [Pedosphaera parvula Ellin514]